MSGPGERGVKQGRPAKKSANMPTSINDKKKNESDRNPEKLFQEKDQEKRNRDRSTKLKAARGKKLLMSGQPQRG